MAGRAGRYGLDSHGESYLFCNKSNFKKTQEMTVQELPPMKQDSEEDEMTQLAQSILEAIHDNIVETDSDVRRYCRCSLHSFKSDFGSNTQTQTQHDNDRITNSLLLLTQKKFIEEVIIDEITVLRSTPLGSSTVLSTLSPTDAVILHQQLSEALPSLNLTNDLHVLFLVAPLTITFEPSWDIYERILDELPPQELEVSKTSCRY
ncbi:helicase and polymerase-containing protein TEBICHI-like [Entamoeba marina]